VGVAGKVDPRCRQAAPAAKLMDAYRLAGMPE
jgi:hypothetical protein